MGAAKHYNPELDAQKKIQDMKEDWEFLQNEKEGKEEVGDEDSEFSPKMHEYFRRNRGGVKTNESIDEKSATTY